MGNSVLDLTGLKYGRLTCLRRAENIGGRVAWECRCDCGRTTTVRANSLRTGNTSSCGCGVPATLLGTHGHSRHPLYFLWLNIRHRTTDPNSTGYEWYGARGISMYPDWLNDPGAFISYLEGNLGARPSKDHTLDRIDNNRGYEPGNLRWATKSEQTANRRPNITNRQYDQLLAENAALKARIAELEWHLSGVRQVA